MAESETELEESGKLSEMSQQDVSGPSSMEVSVMEESGESSSQIHHQQHVEESSWPSSREDYRLVEIIGNGAISTVYRGVCVERREICAIKRINLENYDLAQLGKEIRALKICRHTNIVSYYTSFYVGGNMWVVMRLLDRGSLRQIMDRLITSMGGRNALTRGLLTQPVIATILKQILAGLEYIHDGELIHGDVKTSNILISSEGNVQLADFGPSVWVESEERTRKSMPGTACYMAPEIAVLQMDDLKKGAYTCNADIWSLGITALEMVTGYPPYYNKVASMTLKWIQQNDPPSLETYQTRDYHEYGKKYRHFLSTCLRKNAKLRWQARRLILHPFITSLAQNSEYLTHTLLESLPPVATPGDEQSSSRQLPPIIDVNENVEDLPPNVVWDYDIEVEEEQRINRISKKPAYTPTRIPPSAELSMSVSVTQYEEKEAESETIITEAELLHSCQYSIEEQVFQLVKDRKLETKYMVIVMANLCKVVTAAQRQDLEGKSFAFVIEKRKQFVTVLEICISAWCYTTDHRH
ncbi:STE/STE20/FRAY protein kinase [Loa loa]|uniref:STE/STE20/FRAY protein kinase n=3 Tax=Loa loa TaxID=7209 RepID=A0A1S0UKB5_LOALO|nr:STE/STE20/FRAY protein kinase [Loa loa]EJD75234.1 STE/STE20/FRAY protein kinase [Loa loa]